MQNLSNADIFFDKSIDDLLQGAISELVRISSKVAVFDRSDPKHDKRNDVEALTRMLSDAHIAGAVALNPWRFTLMGPRLGGFMLKILIDANALAADVLTKLDANETWDKITFNHAQKQQQRYRNMYYRLVCSLAMTSTGKRCLEDFSEDEIIQWFSFHTHSEDGGFRRPDLWATSHDVAGRCLKQMAKTFARIYGSARIQSFSKIKRPPKVKGSFGSQRWDNLHLITDPPAHLKEWVELFKRWRKNEPPVQNGPRRSVARCLSWLNTLGPAEVSDPKRFLTTRRSISYLEALTRLRISNGQKTYNNDIDKELADVRRFSLFSAQELELDLDKIRIFPLVSDRELAYLRNASKKAGAAVAGEASSNPLPFHLYALLQEVLLEGEDGWPGRQSMCRVYVAGEYRYSPLYPTIFLTPFQLPERIVQIRRLDSGEGDLKRFDGHSMTWVENSGPHAGYWRNMGADDPRGYARRVGRSTVTGFFINSNKTGKPFVIPWQNSRAHSLLYS